jgi:hypothetical protein
VVATQPQLGDALETMVVGHHLGNQVTVVVDDGHLSRMIVVQVLGDFSLQHKVLVVELLHNDEFVLVVLFTIGCKDSELFP